MKKMEIQSGNYRSEGVELLQQGELYRAAFNGKVEIEECPNWIAEVESFFDIMQVAEDRKGSLLAYIEMRANRCLRLCYRRGANARGASHLL